MRARPMAMITAQLVRGCYIRRASCDGICRGVLRPVGSCRRKTLQGRRMSCRSTLQGTCTRAAGLAGLWGTWDGRWTDDITTFLEQHHLLNSCGIYFPPLFWLCSHPILCSPFFTQLDIFDWT